jgi:hypothetical protein
MMTFKNLDITGQSVVVVKGVSSEIGGRVEESRCICSGGSHQRSIECLEYM